MPKTDTPDVEVGAQASLTFANMKAREADEALKARDGIAVEAAAKAVARALGRSEGATPPRRKVARAPAKTGKA